MLNVKRNSNDPFETYYNQYDYAVDIKARIVYLIGTIAAETASDFLFRCKWILDNESEEDKDKPITLHINSPGGDVYGMLGIIDTMNDLPVKVNTVCLGQAQSAAAVILAAGTGTRKCYKHSIIMLHELRSWISGSASELNNVMQQIKDLENDTNVILSECTKKDKSFWVKNQKTDLYVKPAKALEFGIIDEII